MDLTTMASRVDEAIIEAYDSTLGTASATCPALSGTQTCTLSFADDVNLMCAFLPASVVNIGLDAHNTGTNPIGGQAFNALQSYGITKISVWPDSNSNGPGGTYRFMDTASMQPTTDTWYGLLSGFLASYPP